MSSSAPSKGSSWSDPFHRSLRYRVKLAPRYHQHLCLPQLQRGRDRMSAFHINHNKESGIDASSRLFNNAQVPPSSMLDPSLLTSVHDNIYADDFGLDVGTGTSMEECCNTEGLSDHSGHCSSALSPSEASTFIHSIVVGSSAPAVVHDAAHISAQNLSTTAAILTPASTPRPADTPSAAPTLPAASKVVPDAAPEFARVATAVQVV